MGGRTEASITPGSGPVAPPTKSHLDLFAVSLLTAICVCLAIGQVAIKVANTGISPVLQAGLRSLAGAVVIGLFAWARGIPLFRRDGIHWPALSASLLFAAEFAFLYPGLQLTTASHAVILLYSSPFVVAAGAHWLVPGDRLSRSKIGGLVFALLGVGIVVLGREAKTAAGGEGPTLQGDLLCLAAAIAWGSLTLNIRATRLAQVAPERVMFILFLLSGPQLIGLAWLLGERGITNPSPLVLGSFAFTVVFVAGIGFTTTTWLFTRYQASRVMAFMMLTPVFGVVMANLLLAEPMGPGLVAGLCCVVAGLWLVNRR